MSGGQNCGRALEQMIQCVALAVRPFPPYIHLSPPDVTRDECSKGFPTFYLSSTPVYQCECKRKVKHNRKCVSETRLGRDFISTCFRNSAGEVYRSWYTYFSNLVARTRLCVSIQCNIVIVFLVQANQIYCFTSATYLIYVWAVSIHYQQMP